MGRTVDQDVQAAFVEFRAKEDDKVRDCIFHNISNPPVSVTYETRLGRFLHSASLCSVSIVNKFAQRIPRDRSSIFFNALVCAATLTHLSPPSLLPLSTASALPMDIPTLPEARQLHPPALQKALLFRLPVAH
jgi:hypothetical protein